MNAEELKKKRTAAGMTQRQVAEAIGLSGPEAGRMVSRWERGTRTPSTVTAKALLAVLTSKNK